MSERKQCPKCLESYPADKEHVCRTYGDTALKRQVGGSHYNDYVVQPYEFFLKNNIPHHKAAVIRRILRYDHPTGKGLQDLQKIAHEIEMIIELEGWRENCNEK